MMQAVRLTSGMIPREALLLAAQCLSQLMQLELPAAEGELEETSPVYVAWEGCTSFFEAVASGAFPALRLEVAKGQEYAQGSQGAELIDILSQCLQAAVQYETGDPLLFLCILTIIESLLPCLDFQPDALSYILDKLCSAVEFGHEDDEDRHAPGLSPRARARRKACSALVNLCSHPPPCLLASLQDLCVRVQTLMAKPHLQEMQRRLVERGSGREGGGGIENGDSRTSLWSPTQPNHPQAAH